MDEVIQRIQAIIYFILFIHWVILREIAQYLWILAQLNKLPDMYRPFSNEKLD